MLKALINGKALDEAGVEETRPCSQGSYNLGQRDKKILGNQAALWEQSLSSELARTAGLMVTVHLCSIGLRGCGRGGVWQTQGEWFYFF